MKFKLLENKFDSPNKTLIAEVPIKGGKYKIYGRSHIGWDTISVYYYDDRDPEESFYVGEYTAEQFNIKQKLAGLRRTTNDDVYKIVKDTLNIELTEAIKEKRPLHIEDVWDIIYDNTDRYIDGFDDTDEDRKIGWLIDPNTGSNSVTDAIMDALIKEEYDVVRDGKNKFSIMDPSNHYHVVEGKVIRSSNTDYDPHVIISLYEVN